MNPGRALGSGREADGAVPQELGWHRGMVEEGTGEATVGTCSSSGHSEAGLEKGVSFSRCRWRGQVACEVSVVPGTVRGGT